MKQHNSIPFAALAVSILVSASCILRPRIPPQCVVTADDAVRMENTPGYWDEIHLGSRPAVSPDGLFFMFEWRDRIWKAPVAGGTAVRASRDEADESWPVLSPDGKRVAFLTESDGYPRLVEFSTEPDAGAAKGKFLTVHTEHALPLFYSSDGSNIVAEAWRDGASVRHCRRAALLRADGSFEEEILFDAPAAEPALSPDGKRVLFRERGEEYYRKRPRSRSSASGRIWLYDRETAEFKCIVDRPGDSRTPAWTPDGKGFYYLHSSGGARNVWHRSLETGADRQVTFFADDLAFAPSLSGDGRTMIVRWRFDFWALDPTLDAPVPRRIALKAADGSAGSGISPVQRRYYASAWNNDGDGDFSFTDGGDTVAFTAGGVLWIMDAEKRKPAPARRNVREHVRECVFSPSGDRLYYLADRGDGTDLRVVKRENGDAPWAESRFKDELLSAGESARNGLSVSPDGGRVAWCDARGRIHFADRDGRETAVSQVPCTGCGGYAWSPDGEYVAASFTGAGSNADIWIVSARNSGADAGESGFKPYRLTSHHMWEGRPAWSPDGKIIAFSARRESGSRIVYVYLDPADEEAEGKGGKPAPGWKIVPGGDGTAAPLELRLRETGIAGDRIFFGPDSRTLAFDSGGGTCTIHIPDKIARAEKMFDFRCEPRAWIKTPQGERVLHATGLVPSIGTRKLDFRAYVEVDVAAYRELAFRTAWAAIRDNYYDPGTHGADWNAIFVKYLAAARNSASWSVFYRVIALMLGELDSSHLGFYESDGFKKEWKRSADKGWKPVTAHLGLRFKKDRAEDGWEVEDAVPGTPAHLCGGFRKGDVVVAVDGRPAGNIAEYARTMTGPGGREFDVTRVRDGGKPETFRVKGVTFEEVRAALRKEEMRAAREYVHARSGGRAGYIAMDAMNAASLDSFTRDAIEEGMSRDALVIDVRDNTGGFTADKILAMVCGPSHARSAMRGDVPEGYLLSYWGRPVLADKPVAVLINHASFSNSEIFAHAVKELKRGPLVGRATGGNVIATTDLPLLDAGMFRHAHIGMFTADGTDMEHHGAEPDIEADKTPADFAAGRDPQLDAAVDAVLREAEERKAPPPLRFAR